MTVHISSKGKGKGLLNRLSWWLYCLLLVCASIPVAMIIRLVSRDVQEFSVSGRRNGIAMLENSPPTQWTLPRETLPNRGPLQDAVDSGPDENGAHYFDDDARRKAASALARTGDLEGALSLLNADNDVRTLSRSAGQAAVTRLRTEMPLIWDRQMAELKTYWKSMDNDGRRHLYSTQRQAQAEALTDALTEDDMDRLTLIRLMPESLWFTMLSNIHASLAGDSVLPPGVIRLFLDPMTRSDRFANRLYWKGIPAESGPISAHVSRFGQALTITMLWPILKDRAGSDQTALVKGDTQWTSWYESVWGVTFCTMFKDFNLGGETAHLQFPWKSLIPQARNLWADRLLREFETQAQTSLSPAVVTAHPWLSDSSKSVDPGFILSRVRGYPEWYNALLVFDYDRAEAAAFDALKTMQAGWLFVRTTRAGKVITLESLSSDLTKEKKAFISTKFPWLELIAELGGINEGVPYAVRIERGWKATPKKTGTRWKDIKPPAVVGALRSLGQKKAGKKRIFEKLAMLYATNRNLPAKRED